MTKSEALEKVLLSFKRYYNIKQEDVTEPFAAEAEFRTHDEHYFLVKSAKLFESESKEYAFFAVEDSLDRKRFEELDERAWTEGLSRVQPREGHKSTDVLLIILADKIEESLFPVIKKQRHYKSYRLSLYGWSQYRLIAIELSTGRIAHNRQGQNLKKLFSNIFKQ